MNKSIITICVLVLFLQACMKSFDASPEPPDSWSPSFSVPIGATTVPEDSLTLGEILPAFPLKRKDGSVFRFDGLTYNLDSEQFGLEGRIFFDFSSLVADFTEVELIMFKLKTQNGFPTSVVTNVDILDGSENVLFSLIEDGDIFANHEGLDENGLVKEPVEYASTIRLSDNDMQQLKNAKYLDFELGVSTKSLLADTVTFKRSYALGIEVGVRVDLKIQNP